MNFLYNLLRLALIVAILGVLIGAAGMATVNIPLCWVALKVLTVAGGIALFAAAARLILEGLGR